MSLSTRNSRDAGLFPGAASAVLPDVSTQSSQPATSSIPAVTSVASPLSASQLSPDCLAAIVQAVRASFAAEAPPGSLSQSSSLPVSVAVVGTSCSSPPVPGGDRSWSRFRRSSLDFAGLWDKFSAAMSTSIDFVFSR